jgi:hypothetical protein
MSRPIPARSGEFSRLGVPNMPPEKDTIATPPEHCATAVRESCDGR